MKSPKPKQHGIVKHGIGYDLIVTQERSRLVLGIRCHKCQRISYHPQDVTERYCDACHVFHTLPTSRNIS